MLSILRTHFKTSLCHNRNRIAFQHSNGTNGAGKSDYLSRWRGLRGVALLFMMLSMHIAFGNSNASPKALVMNDPGPLKKYMLGNFDVNYFPTELNVFYGATYSKLKYGSFQDYHALYQTLYSGSIPDFKTVWSSAYGIGFRILGVGLELGKNTLSYTTSLSENAKNHNGTRTFALDLNENTMAFFLGYRTKRSLMGIHVGGVFGKATLTPSFTNTQGLSDVGGISYLNGIYKTSYNYPTLGLEYGIGYGRIRLVGRYEWSIKPLLKDDLFPYGQSIRDDNQKFQTTDYGPYIPRDMEGYTLPDPKAGAGNGHNYIGSDIRSQRLTLRLEYSIIYRKMPMNKKK